MKIRFQSVERGVCLFDVLLDEFDAPTFTGTKEECGRYLAIRADKQWRAKRGSRHVVPFYDRQTLPLVDAV